MLKKKRSFKNVPALLDFSKLHWSVATRGSVFTLFAGLALPLGPQEGPPALGSGRWQNEGMWRWETELEGLKGKVGGSLGSSNLDGPLPLG